MNRDLARILPGVSRSFGLSLKLLPSPLRDPVGIAYLLARATDTLADSGSADADADARIGAIGRLVGAAERGEPWAGPGPIEPDSRDERDLLAALPALLAAFRALGPADRDDILRVLREISGGQVGDLVRDWPVRSPEELDRYTFQVAGCVGEFWTRIAARKLPRFARKPAAEMIAHGIGYGKGLQLVNILRDLPRDLAAGRQYLPELSDPCWSFWKTRCAALLREGAGYSAALGRGRLRYATLLPWFLGAGTLRLLPARLPEPGSPGVKVGRDFVAATLRRGLLAAVSDRCHAALVRDAFRPLETPPQPG
jgi:farnesyl-diphosphate farnesyltransferase